MYLQLWRDPLQNEKKCPFFDHEDLLKSVSLLLYELLEYQQKKFSLQFCADCNHPICTMYVRSTKSQLILYVRSTKSQLILYGANWVVLIRTKLQTKLILLVLKTL